MTVNQEQVKLLTQKAKDKLEFIQENYEEENNNSWFSLVLKCAILDCADLLEELQKDNQK